MVRRAGFALPAAPTAADTGSGGTYAAVDSFRVQGTLPAFAASDDATLKYFGVRPTKRYVQAVITPTGATSGGPFTVFAVLGNGGNNPPATS